MSEIGVYPVRLSTRITETNYEKLVQIAEANGWVNASGKPNISAAVNHVIGGFEVKPPKRGKQHGK